MFEQVIKVLEIQIILSSQAEKEWRKELKAAIEILKKVDVQKININKSIIPDEADERIWCK